MKKLVFCLLIGIFAASFVLHAESLDEIKIAADAGDPAAQDKLAEQYVLRVNSAEAEAWYHKSAEQGYSHAQGKLGDMLFLRSKIAVGLKAADRAAMGDEAFKWLTLAANQGDAQGQADLATIYLEGKLAKQDLIEAYKWGELATRGGGLISIPVISGGSTKNTALLKMDAVQIAEAKHRAAEFQPHVPVKSDMPEPFWVKQIKLGGIGGSPDHRLAIINNATFGQGESGSIKAGGKQVTIKCLEITDSKVTFAIEGINSPATLQLK